MLIIIVIYQLGNQIAQFFQLKVPGNVIGIVILFVLLWMGVIKTEQIEMAAGWLLKHLGFFFIPISVGLMTLGDILVNKGLYILFILMVSAFIGLLAAGKATQSVIMKKEKAEVNYHDHAL
ncbi:CidA/LrgA family protein [Neobacillus soli]|nr:CidA/LrgA family protein [Neobacillus soli]